MTDQHPLPMIIETHEGPNKGVLYIHPKALLASDQPKCGNCRWMRSSPVPCCVPARGCESALS